MFIGLRRKAGYRGRGEKIKMNENPICTDRFKEGVSGKYSRNQIYYLDNDKYITNKKEKRGLASVAQW